MSVTILNLINQLNPYEENQVIDYVKSLINKREIISDEEGRNNFHALREEALKNKPEGMSLDEINAIIKEARQEKYTQEAIAWNSM